MKKKYQIEGRHRITGCFVPISTVMPYGKIQEELEIYKKRDVYAVSYSEFRIVQKE